MKTQTTLFTLMVAGILAFSVGCGKKDASVEGQMKDAAGNAGDAVKNAAGTVKEAGEKAVTAVTEKAKEVAAPVSARVQELIDSAKSLVGAGKYQDALAKLKEIGAEKLSVEQQAMVDALLAQIQKALAATSKGGTDAAGAVGGLLNK